MKRPILLFLLCCTCLPLTATVRPDFAVTGILIKNGPFITIKIQNLSAADVNVKPADKEKIFLTIYLDNVKRSEYKLKYLDSKLFRRRSTVFLRTNFPVPAGGKTITVKAHINRLKVIEEANFANNVMVKKVGNN